MLWLALYLPQLPLECAATGIHDGHARLVYDTLAGRQNVYRLNAAAVEAGIEPGMPLTAARSLCTELIVHERDSVRETTALKGLALWAQQFTSKVSLQPPYGLILEIGASLTLFAGAENIRHKTLSGLSALGYSAHSGIAPVATAAWLLALQRQSQLVTQSEQIRKALSPLPLSLLPISDAKKSALYNLGLKCLGDCLRLPRAGLSQRLGTALLEYLDRALGRSPDPREFHTAPERFQSQVLMPEPVTQVEPLLFILKRLLAELGGFLRVRDAGVQQLSLLLIMPFLPVERLQLTLLQPGRDPEHLFRLWQEKLERHSLLAPVEGLELQARQLLPLVPLAVDLLGMQQRSGSAFMHTLERLKNRLGERAIQQPFCVADHRPEYADGQATFPAPPHAFNPEQGAQRPLWLLPQPRALAQSADGGPYLQGSLKLLSGPERIEAGWWDGGDQRRDYYVARSHQQQKLWVYRDLGKPPRWFLHGFFS
jgi:protein ImuB